MRILILSIKFIFLFGTLTLTLSCSKSPKSMLSGGETWMVTKPGDRSSQSLSVQFTDNQLISIPNNEKSNIEWINSNTFRINGSGSGSIVSVEKVAGNKLRAAFLYENEKIPGSVKEWDELQNDGRVLVFEKKSGTSKTYEFYKVGTKSIRAEKVPPEGLYEYGDLAVKIFISDGIVKFQFQEDKSTGFKNVEPEMEESGSFSFVGSMGSYFEYIGNGIIRNSGNYYHGMSDETSDFKIRTNNINENNDELLTGTIDLVSKYGYIYKNGEKFGKIVKLTISGAYPHSGGNLVKLNIPAGKMWTPLFYEQVKGNRDLSVMEVFHKTNGGFGYWDYSKFEITKSHFVSAKYSKQNNESYQGNGLVGISITSFARTRTVFNFYLLEESY